MIVKVRKLREDAKLPLKATEGSACYDVCTCEDLILRPGQIKAVGTGLSFEPPPNYFIEIRPRSGLALKGLMVLNSPATIDPDYRGEVKVILGLPIWAEPLRIEKGMRIAQLALRKVREIEFFEVSQLNPTKRGSNGFGSTDSNPE